MHSYLIISKDPASVEEEIESIKKRHKLTLQHFDIEKIEDTKALKNLTKLDFNKPYGIVIKNIHNASSEALNAFLKSLEEPQQNVYFILSAPSRLHLLQTIVSRCQVINLVNKNPKPPEEIEKLFKKNKSDIVEYVIENLNDRPSALNFSINFILAGHELLHTSSDSYQDTYNKIENSRSLYKNLKANGNVNLQLTNFIANLV